MNKISLYIGIVAVTLFALLFIKAFDISYPLSITTTQKSSELAVVGEGKVDVVPDTATVSVGITVSNVSTVEVAQKTIDQINNKIIGGMETLGIQKSGIKTANYSISPNYSGQGGNTITGYNGNATLEIKVKKIEVLSRVIEEATTSGANQIYGTSFSVENMEKYREEARNNAIENAKQQAQKLSKNLGIKIGKVTNIVESAPQNPIMFRNAVASGIGGEAPEIEPGIQTITSTVTLYFEKK